MDVIVSFNLIKYVNTLVDFVEENYNDEIIEDADIEEALYQIKKELSS